MDCATFAITFDMNELRNFLQNQHSEYEMGPIERDSLLADPIEQFKVWFKEATNNIGIEVNVMNLATVDKYGQPSSRIVLLKDVDKNGFVFYTNYLSRKAKEIQSNPFAAINFFWHEQVRQIRIEGKLIKVSEKDSDDYFKLRPRMSQIGAIASAQSEVIESREILEERIVALDKQYADSEVPRPPHWGGYLLIPHEMEFWQGRPSRLHDRFRYSLQEDNNWQIDRLSP